jgi:hypothetical protein
VRGGRPDSAEAVADLRLFGLREEEIAQAAAELGQGEPEFLGIFPENWETVSVFVAMETQWDVAVGPMGGLTRLGLKYPSFETVARNLGVKRKRRPEVFDGLRTMELAVLGAGNE